MIRRPGESDGRDELRESSPVRTLVSQLTPEGRGAIGIIRVWGPDAIGIADAVFRPQGGRSLAQTDPRHLRLGRIGDAPGDEVVVAVLETAVPTVEVQCHGGTAAIELVLDEFEKAGAERCDRGRASEQATADRLSAEAFEDLAHASTILTAEILLDQAQGALRRELERLKDAIDRQPVVALADIEKLIRSAAAGMRLLAGWRIVIAGRPNVGKSRLLNALAGYSRAIVDPTPGTTRDSVSVRTSFGGWPVQVVDTAGMRTTGDVIENLGIAMSRREQERADLVLLVLDRSEPLQPIDRQLVATRTGALLVANKADLAPTWSADDASMSSDDIATVSADRGDGISSLITAIVERLVPDRPLPGGAVPFRPAQLEHLHQIRANLLDDDRAAALQGLDSMLLQSPRILP